MRNAGPRSYDAMAIEAFGPDEGPMDASGPRYTAIAVNTPDFVRLTNAVPVRPYAPGAIVRKASIPFPCTILVKDGIATLFLADPEAVTECTAQNGTPLTPPGLILPVPVTPPNPS